MAIADDLQNAHERDLQLGILVDEHGIRLVGGDVFEDISRLAFKHLAQHVERAETDCPDLAGLDAREIDVGDSHLISKLVQRDMPIRHDLVKMKNDWHRIRTYIVSSESSCKRTPYLNTKEKANTTAAATKGNRLIVATSPFRVILAKPCCADDTAIVITNSRTPYNNSEPATNLNRRTCTMVKGELPLDASENILIRHRHATTITTTDAK